MPHREFIGCWDRLARVEHHRAAFATAWNELVGNDAFDARVHVGDDGTGSVSIVPRYEPLPPVFALELGEILYQLRATLDGAVYAVAVRETGQNPPPNAEQPEFPICEDPRSFERVAARKIAPFTGMRRRIVEDCQPYNMPAGLRPEILIFSPHRALWMIHDWARKDRHRTLHVAAAWVSGAAPLVEVPPPARVVDLRPLPDGYLTEWQDIATFRVVGWQPGMQARANPNAMLDIAVLEGPPPCAGNDTLGNRVKAMVIFVKDVVSGLEKSCGDIPRRTTAENPRPITT